MKSLCAGVMAMALVALNGCTQGTPGGPGTTAKPGSTTAQNPMLGQAEDTFNLSVPTMTSSLQQGTQMEATVGIKRATNFDQDVALQFSDVPMGVTIEPASPVIKHGDTDAKLTFKAVDDAVLGDFKVKVTGHPTKGSDAEIEFKITVAAKDTFQLTVPLLSTSVAQGESKAVSIGMKREKNFDQDVALTFGDMPTGVTMVPDKSTLEHGDLGVNVVVTAEDDAALGDFTVKLTGHPTKGADATTEVKITITAK